MTNISGEKYLLKTEKVTKKPQQKNKCKSLSGTYIYEHSYLYFFKGLHLSPAQLQEQEQETLLPEYFILIKAILTTLSLALATYTHPLS